MHSYAVFGVRLDSAFEFPELRPAPTHVGPAWRVEVANGDPPAVALAPTGSENIAGTVCVRAYHADDVARLEYDDTGTFDVIRRERLIRWYPRPDVNPLAARADLLGRVMALAAHADGQLVLHASAVSTDHGVVALLGPKHAGKSTMALALVRRGARLVTDDTLVLRFDGDGIVVALPGVQRIRLWPDSARALGATALSGQDSKPTIDDIPMHSLEHAERRLAACYLVHPVASSDSGAISRRPLSDVQAAVTAISCSKLGGLGGGRLALEILERATRLARVIPSYVAEVPRDLNRLDAVAADLMRWQTVPMPNAVSTQ